MDFSKFKTNDWLVVGGGALMLIAGFLSWFSASIPGGASGSNNAFDYFFTGTVPWILLVAAGVVVLLVTGGVLKAKIPPMVILAATGLATILVLLRVVIGHGVDIPAGANLSIGRSTGLWLALIAGIIATAGAFLGFQAAGGNLKDFTDPNKLKGAVRDIDRG